MDLILEPVNCGPLLFDEYTHLLLAVINLRESGETEQIPEMEGLYSPGLTKKVSIWTVCVKQGLLIIFGWIHLLVMV